MLTIDSTTFKVGDRVRLVHMPNDPDPIPDGTLGTVRWISDLSRVSRTPEIQVGVGWDNGRSLSCICPPDILVLVSTKDNDEKGNSDEMG